MVMDEIGEGRSTLAGSASEKEDGVGREVLFESG